MRKLPKSPNDMTRRSANEVRLMREELGYSEQDWAALVGVDVRTVRAWENIELTNSPDLPEYFIMQSIYKRQGASFLTNEHTISQLINLFMSLPAGLKKRLVALFQEKIRDEN